MTKQKEFSPNNMKNVDDLLHKTEQEKLGKIVPEIPVAKSEEKAEEVQSQVAEDKSPPAPEQKLDETEEPKGQTEESQEEAQQELKVDATETSAEDQNEVDDYGTKVGKKKLYTEDEVFRMIKERLKRGQQPDQSPQQQQAVQQAAKDFTPDPESGESWETQLESFVEKTVQKMTQKRAEAEWKQREDQSQAEFEIKFTQGMSKYGDFKEVVTGKPITNAMMLATRTMKDPAAFIYAASKQQPKELARIAAIPDAVTQAVEIGRLEERMKKARTIPASPKPATRVKGDASSELPQISIDARIAAHAKSKIMR